MKNETELQKHFREKGMTASAVAKATGLHPNTIYKLLQGHSVTTNTVKKLIRIGIPRDVILDTCGLS